MITKDALESVRARLAAHLEQENRTDRLKRAQRLNKYKHVCVGLINIEVLKHPWAPVHPRPSECIFVDLLLSESW